MAIMVDLDALRREALGENDPLLERLADLFVVEGVGRAVDQAPAVGDRHASPGLQQPEPLLGTSGAQRSRVRQELFGDSPLLGAPGDVGAELLVARQELFYLNR